MTFTKRQKVNGIQQVGFSHTVVANKTIDFGRKIQLRLTDIFIIDNVERFDVHANLIKTLCLQIYGIIFEFHTTKTKTKNTVSDKVG
jgi:hypothetical protein